MFLHPHSREEYALARTERKQGHGHTGFAVHCDPSVTLEQDLERRDLTINAMAMTAEGRLVDPWGGRRDLEAKLLRHVSPAFVEDPLRVLRTARFAARYAHLGFTVAPETLDLMRSISRQGNWSICPRSGFGSNLTGPWASAIPRCSYRCCATARHWPACCRRWMPCSACPRPNSTTRRSTPASTP